MTDPILLEGVARGVAIGGFAATGAALAASRKLTPMRWIGVAFFVCAIAHVIDSWSGSRHPDLLAWALSVTGTGVFWLFAVSLFEDEPALTPWRFAPVALMFGFWLVGAFAPAPVGRWSWPAYGVTSVVLVIHVLSIAWRGWRDDLVDQRRRLRAPLAAASAGYVLVQAACDFGWSLNAAPFDPSMVQALSLAGLSIATAVALLRVEPLLVATPASAGPATAMPTVEAGDLSPADRLVLNRLNQAMSQDEVWRGEDLSIGALAALVGAPEHRLRRLINGTLGHRNFADYVNSRRIAAAKEALSDPNLALKPISTIAYDLGFASLGPFNRAFRAAVGVTPTAWRQEACGAPHLRLVETRERPLKSDKST